MECFVFQNVRNKPTRVASIYEDNNLELYIIVENESFYCKVERKDVQSFASLFEMKEDEYMSSLISYIRQPNSDISVDVLDNKFIIYKNKKIKYFFTTVKRTDYSTTVSKILDTISKSIAEFKQEATDLSKNNEELQIVKQTCKDKLEQYVQENDEKERKLYSCFVQVLNEKKKRIRFLNDLLEAPEPKRKSLNQSHDFPLEVKAGPSRAVQVLSDSDDYNTDDETSKLKDKETSSKLMIEESTSSPDIQILPKRLSAKGKNGESGLKICQAGASSSTAEPVEDGASRARSLSPISFSTQDIIDRI